MPHFTRLFQRTAGTRKTFRQPARDRGHHIGHPTKASMDIALEVTQYSGRVFGQNRTSCLRKTMGLSPSSCLSPHTNLGCSQKEKNGTWSSTCCRWTLLSAHLMIAEHQFKACVALTCCPSVKRYTWKCKSPVNQLLQKTSNFRVRKSIHLNCTTPNARACNILVITTERDDDLIIRTKLQVGAEPINVSLVLTPVGQHVKTKKQKNHGPQTSMRLPLARPGCMGVQG